MNCDDRAMGSLRLSATDLSLLGEASAAVLLVGGYDGSGNFGDVLQVATAIEAVERLPGSPLPVAVVELEMRKQVEELRQRFPDRFGRAAFAYFDEGDEPAESGLVQARPGLAPAAAAVYVYGGGFLNAWWGARKLAHVFAAEQLAGGRLLPVVASGLQVDEPTVAPGGAAHELLSRASWIGVRDQGSLEIIRRQVPSAAAHLDLGGDDALPFLAGPATAPATEARVVNLHVNDGTWVSDNPEQSRDRVAALLKLLAERAGGGLELQPLVAYEDPRVSERRLLAELLDREGAGLTGAGLTAGEPLDLLADTFDGELRRFRRARLTVSRSYHVTLASLLSGIPAVLLAENEYYVQKTDGLRQLFGLEPGMIGVAGTAEDAEAAAAALVDGPAREVLLEHLREASAEVAERFSRGQVALSAVLVEGLRRAAPEAELVAVRANRGWRALQRARRLGDRLASGA